MHLPLVIDAGRLDWAAIGLTLTVLSFDPDLGGPRLGAPGSDPGGRDAIATLDEMEAVDDGAGRIRVAVLAADSLVERSLRQELEGAEIRVTVTAVSQADALLWDARGDLGVGIDDHGTGPWTVPTLALSPDAETAREALASGCRGVISRRSDGQYLASALTAVAAGLVVIDPEFAELLPEYAAGRFLGRGHAVDGVFGGVITELQALTPRENQVLDLLADGLSNRTIAKRLGLSQHTVRSHVQSILGKLDVDSRTAAVVKATRQGLVTL